MSKQMTEGTRRDFGDDGILNKGEYGKGPLGIWFAQVPTDGIGMANLNKHHVIEHEDGTITVSPSILVRSWRGLSWHGYLEHGVWREV